jgi:hypothetical protein
MNTRIAQNPLVAGPPIGGPYVEPPAVIRAPVSK